MTDVHLLASRADCFRTLHLSPPALARELSWGCWLVEGPELWIRPIGLQAEISGQPG
ncbi:MAG: hypothetical protein Q7V01_08540 [Vicinamibacterales bacterium]|nr:hypothetical protein [Vicinamibacterales bacterium]